MIIIYSQAESTTTKHDTMPNVSVTRIDQFCTKTIDDPPITSEDEETTSTCCSDERHDKNGAANIMMKKPQQQLHKIPEERAPSEKKVHFAAIDDDENNNNSENDKQDAADTTAGAPPLWTTLTSETIDELWYQQSEIANMKAEAKYFILHRSEASPDEVCGLDRFTRERALWKRSAIRYVLMSQKQNKGDEFVRRVSLRCSGWFREKACEQGFKDYCAVHDPLASLLDSDDVENYNDCFFSTTTSDAAAACNNRDDHDESNRPKRSSATESNGGQAATEHGFKRRRTMTVEDEVVTDPTSTLDLQVDDNLLL